jgi:hypothetical protein
MSPRPVSWRGLTDGAPANSIIEYNGTNWSISFDPRELTDVQFVTNLTTQVQYRFVNDEWQKSYEGWYGEGAWRVVI